MIFEHDTKKCPKAHVALTDITARWRARHACTMAPLGVRFNKLRDPEVNVQRIAVVRVWRYWISVNTERHTSIDVIYFKNNISSRWKFRATGCRRKPPPSPRRNRRWSAWQPCRTWTSTSWRCSSSNWIKSSAYFKTLCTRWRSRKADFRNPALASRRLRPTPRVRQIFFPKQNFSRKFLVEVRKLDTTGNTTCINASLGSESEMTWPEIIFCY